MNTNAIDWGSYRIVFNRNDDGVIRMDIHTKLESIKEEEYAQIINCTFNGMGNEGFFDHWLPQQLAVFDKFGVCKVVSVGDIV